jgi:riboflavin kinase/FMN adenylyltransferase
MAIFRHTDEIPSDFSNTIVTIGSFDGVHKGHQTLIDQVINLAQAKQAQSVVITFKPHPRQYLNPQAKMDLLSSVNQKISLLSQYGIDHVMIQAFNAQFAQLSAIEFIEQYLVKYFKPAVIVIGYDHRFGHDRKGDIHLLKQYAKQFGYQIVEINAELINEIEISSTKIRKAITEGDMRLAHDMLDRYYSIEGIVIKGNQLGRTLGFPTANLFIEEEELLIPLKGVYATYTEVDQVLYPSVTSIGYRPTVNASATLQIESHLFDFNNNLYGKHLTIHFVNYLRDELKFDSLEDLVKQMHIDATQARQLTMG